MENVLAYQSGQSTSTVEGAGAPFFCSATFSFFLSFFFFQLSLQALRKREKKTSVPPSLPPPLVLVSIAA